MATRKRFQELPLRQRKQAQTKLGLLEAALAALETRPLESVTVKELCAAVSISEAGFFNYFPRKTDLLMYFVRLWSLEMGWHAGRLAASRGGLAAIEEIFALTGRRVQERPGIMVEIIAEQVRRTERPVPMEISLAERLLVFPELDGIEEVDAVGLEELLPPLIERAVARGELPPATQVGPVLLSLASILFGVPVVLGRIEGGDLEASYLTQLRLLWAGLRAAPQV
jgi:AcrR family transcriptional regulator